MNNDSICITTAEYDAEAGIIGALLIDADHIIGEVMAVVRDEDFSDPTMRYIFRTIRDLWLAQRPVDVLTVSNAVGSEYRDLLLGISTRPVAAAHWRAYADDARAATLGKKIDYLANQLQDAKNLERKLEIVEQMQAMRTASICGMKTVSWLDGLVDAANRYANPYVMPEYLHWGLPVLDDRLFVTAGSFVVLAGLPSKGKTVLATQFCVQWAAAGKRVGFYSLETGDAPLYDRMIAQTARIPFDMIKSRRLGAAEIERVRSAAKTTKNWTLDYVNAGGCSVSDVRAHCLAHRYDVIVIDYVQLLQGSGASRTEEVAKISMNLHAFAQTTGTTVVGLSQVTEMQGQPRGDIGMGNLRESRQLAQDADVIMILNEIPTGTKYDRALCVVKNKDGATFRTRLWLDVDCMLMRAAVAPESGKLP